VGYLCRIQVVVIHPETIFGIHLIGKYINCFLSLTFSTRTHNGHSVQFVYSSSPDETFCVIKITLIIL